MSDLEQDLRATLAAHAPEPADVRAPRWEGAPAETRPPRSSRLQPVAVAAAAAVAVGALVVGVVSVVDGPGGEPAAPASVLPTPTDRSTTVPAGKRPVSYRGVEVLIPADMGTARLQCEDYWRMSDSEPGIDGFSGAVAVGPPSAEADCAASSSLVMDAQFVRLMPDDVGDGLTLARSAVTPVEVNGVAAMSSCADCAVGEFDDGTVLHLPDQGVVITATVLGMGFSQSVLETVRVVETDSLGCATRTPTPLPVSPRVNDVVLWSGSAERVTVCLYRGGVSAGSGTVTGATARTTGELLTPARPDAFGADDEDVCISHKGPIEFDVAGVRAELADGRTVSYAVMPYVCDPFVLFDADDGAGLRATSPDGRETEMLVGLRGRS